MFTYLVPSTALLRLDVCLLACPLTCLTVQLLFFYWWLRSVWNLYWYYFSKLYCFPVFLPISYISSIFPYSYWSPVPVPFSCIHTDLLYQYCFHVLWYTIVISTVLITWYIIIWYLTLACYHLKPACYHLYLATWYITTWLAIIIFRESCPAILYYIYSDLYF